MKAEIKKSFLKGAALRRRSGGT